MAKLIKVWDGSAWQTVGTASTVGVQGTTGTQGTTGAQGTTGVQGTTGAAGAPAVTSSAISTNQTLVSGFRYLVNTSAARSLTLPASPAVGDAIEIFDASGTAGTNNITVNNNSLKINGVTDTAIIDVNGAAAIFVYTGSTYGWRMG
jgi:hypothetical protein